jgi:Leucine-rich repeat (LRR) protein
MELKYYQLITLAVVLLCTIQQTQCRHREGKESRKAKSADLTVTSRIHNLCLSDRDSKLACHCTPDDPDTKAKKANCYIFTDNLTRKDAVWLSFHTQTSLEYLIFTVRRSGLLTFIPSDVIVTLKNLKELTIEYGQIDSVEPNTFGALSELTNISLPENSIKIVREAAFDNLVKLEEINLEKNNISELDKRAFVNLPSLVRLRLGTNKISVIHDDMFVELERLDELRLEANVLSVLTKEGFRGLANLRMLKLSSNNINYLGESVFAELWNLQELYLDNNKIEVSWSGKIIEK